MLLKMTFEQQSLSISSRIVAAAAAAAAPPQE